MSMNRGFSMQNGLTDPVTLTFDILTQKRITSSISQLPRSFLHQVWTLWDHSFLNYAADKQINRQAEKTAENPAPRRLRNFDTRAVGSIDLPPKRKSWMNEWMSLCSPPFIETYREGGFANAPCVFYHETLCMYACTVREVTTSSNYGFAFNLVRNISVTVDLVVIWMERSEYHTST